MVLAGKAAREELAIRLRHMNERVGLGAKRELGPDEIGVGIDLPGMGIFLPSRSKSVALDVVRLKEDRRPMPLGVMHDRCDALGKGHREDVIGVDQVDPCGRDEFSKLVRQSPRRRIPRRNRNGVVASGQKPLQVRADPASARTEIGHAVHIGKRHG
jgi:hypothetical protein